MTAWTTEDIQKIAATDDLHIAPLRDDSVTYGTPTWIWSVVVDGRLFVRAWSGVRSLWYRAAIAQGIGRITAAGARYEVAFANADPALNERIDAACRDKVRGQPVPAADDHRQAEGRHSRDHTTRRNIHYQVTGEPMKIAVLGTGMVGQALAARLAGLGHDVAIGTRDPAQTLARAQSDGFGNPPYAIWQQSNPDVRLLAFPQAGAHGEVILNATHGAVALEALEAVGADNLAGKVLIDLAIPLDLSQGMPPTVLVAADDSLGERIQQAFPDTRVVKTLNTVFFQVMIDPSRVPGEHDIFIAGDDGAAKKTACELLQGFGWPEKSIIDLGGIRGARGAEGYMQLYFILADKLGHFDFNIHIARA